MAEKADGSYDPGGEGGGFGGGGGEPDPGQGRITLTDEDAGFDGYADRYNDQNRNGHELNDPSDNDPADPKKAKKHVAPPAPPVDHNAPVGSKTNPIHSKTGGL